MFENAIFDELFKDKNTGDLFLYFTIPLEEVENITQKKYYDASGGEVCLQIHNDLISNDSCDASISPTEYDFINDCYIDYEWSELKLEDEDFAALVEIAGITTIKEV